MPFQQNSLTAIISDAKEFTKLSRGDYLHSYLAS